MKNSLILILLSAALFSACGGADSGEQAKAIPFEPFVITDSSAVVHMESGVDMYIIRQGPGRRAADMPRLVMHFEARTPDGRVFDSSYQRGAPIEGPLSDEAPELARAIKQLPLGSQAVIVLPPEVTSAAPKVVDEFKGETLIYHIDLLGAFL